MKLLKLFSEDDATEELDTYVEKTAESLFRQTGRITTSSIATKVQFRATPHSAAKKLDHFFNAVSDTE